MKMGGWREVEGGGGMQGSQKEAVEGGGAVLVACLSMEHIAGQSTPPPPPRKTKFPKAGHWEEVEVEEGVEEGEDMTVMADC